MAVEFYSVLLNFPSILYFLQLVSQGLSTEVQHRYYVQNINFQDVRFDQYVIQDYVTESLYDCLLKCDSNNICSSVQYRYSRRTCRLLYMAYLSANSGMYEDGWKYYDNSGGKCPLGFIDRRTVPQCFKFIGFYNKYLASPTCKALGAEIMAVESEDDNTFMSMLGETLFNPYGIDYTNEITIQGTFNTSHWVFDNGDVMTYFKWDFGHPDTRPSFDTIRLVRYSPGQFLWRSALSKRKDRPIICALKYKI